MRPRTSPCRPRCSKRASLAGSRRLFRRLHAGGRPHRSTRRPSSRPSGSSRSSATPSTRTALQPRAQPEGSSRRACATCRSILWIAPRRPASASDWKELASARPASPARKRALLARLQRLPAGPAHPPALPRRPPRGPHRCSTTRTRWPRQFGYAATPRPARQRAADAALLPHRQGDHAAQHHPAAEPRRGDLRAERRHAAAAAQRALPGALHELLEARDPRICSSASRTPSSRASCCCSSTPNCKGMTARTLRALWRARGMRIDAQLPPRPGQPRRCSCRSCSSRAASCTSSGA